MTGKVVCPVCGRTVDAYIDEIFIYPCKHNGASYFNRVCMAYFYPRFRYARFAYFDNPPPEQVDGECIPGNVWNLNNGRMEIGEVKS